jgi:two-component system sensor histidine kinase HydH/two-component system sensor histidine kinase AtoS
VGTRFRFYSEVLVRILPEGEYAVALEQLAEALPLQIAAVDRSGRVVVWNHLLDRDVRPRREALGRPLLDVMPGLSGDRNFDWGRALAEALAGRPRVDLPRHPLGERVVRAVLAPLLGADGAVEGAALAVEDITDRVRSEERRVLRVRSDAVEALGAGIAHEVRNPLNALSLNLQLLRERLSDPAADRDDLLGKADAMIAELRRMDDLVTHLLEVSRGGPPDRETRPLDPIVARVVERLRPTAERAGTALRFAPGSSRALSLDPARIDRALHNLVRNAIEATPPGGHVWVSTRDDPVSTVVAIEDDGRGIPLEDRSRIFELFFTRKRGGTGLGLPLARRAIQDHGGEIEVLDRPGGGARFLVHLPIGEPEAGDEPGAPGAFPRGARGRGRRGP